VLDEIHLLDNTYRGDQLLKRSEYIAKTDFNIYALSATIADPEDVGGGYLKDFEVIITPDNEKLNIHLLDHLRKQLCKKRETRRCYHDA